MPSIRAITLRALLRTPQPRGLGRLGEMHHRAEAAQLLEANYTGSKQPPAGVGGGDVPAPVAPGENVEHEATPPDAPGDAGEA
jgi:hypothetical protein